MIILLIRDPLYGDLTFNSNEEKLILSKSFNRIRRVKQLSFSEYVYPSATHNRYGHSLGVCEVVTRMFDNIQRKTNVFRKGDRDLIRMIALCHDIGHSPFSHSSEELSNISHEDRMRDVLELESNNIVLDKQYNVEAWDIINQVYNGDGFQYILEPRYALLRSLMDNFIDADKIDYLFRDAVFCGLEYGKFDRDTLINSLTVSNIDGLNTIAIEHKGVQALENLIFARYYMFSQVYYHPTRRLYDILFLKYMKRTLPNGKYPDDIKKFLAWDDSRLIQKLFKSKEFSEDYVLVYDADFNLDVKLEIDRRLGDFVICDTPKKRIIDNINDIYIVDNLLGVTNSIDKVSPIISGLKNKSIHKLRYYAISTIAKGVNEEIKKIVRRLS